MPTMRCFLIFIIFMKNHHFSFSIFYKKPEFSPWERGGTQKVKNPIFMRLLCVVFSIFYCVFWQSSFFKIFQKICHFLQFSRTCHFLQFLMPKIMHFIKIFNVLFLYAYYALFFNFYYFTIKTIIFSLKYVCQKYVFLCKKF